MEFDGLFGMEFDSLIGMELDRLIGMEFGSLIGSLGRYWVLIVRVELIGRFVDSLLRTMVMMKVVDVEG